MYYTVSLITVKKHSEVKHLQSTQSFNTSTIIEKKLLSITFKMNNGHF